MQNTNNNNEKLHGFCFVLNNCSWAHGLIWSVKNIPSITTSKNTELLSPNIKKKKKKKTWLFMLLYTQFSFSALGFLILVKLT
jgi:hypothetical protein